MNAFGVEHISKGALVGLNGAQNQGKTVTSAKKLQAKLPTPSRTLGYMRKLDTAINHPNGTP